MRLPNGTFKYRQINSVDPFGINGQSVYNGTDNADRMFGGHDNDTFWGQNGNDVIEGANGDDSALGGNGNDILTDLDGADISKGGRGNDAIDTGPGDDIYMSGDGSDFINGGANDNEGFAGRVTTSSWPARALTPRSATVGTTGVRYRSGHRSRRRRGAVLRRSGRARSRQRRDDRPAGRERLRRRRRDDIMSQNPAIERNAGTGGFDWVIHQYNTVPADDDMMINLMLTGVPIQIVVNRDRWQETEANSGSSFNDVIRGNSAVVGVPRAIGAGGGGFQGCDVLDQAALDRIRGLDALVPPRAGALTSNVNAPQPDIDPTNTPRGLTSIIGLSASGRCPLSGPFWGKGDIELGGAGSDQFFGRDGNDIIDGDSELRVRILVRNAAGAVLGLTDLMENRYQRDGNGNLIGNTLQQDVLAGLIDPGNLSIVREIVNMGGPADVDTVNFTKKRVKPKANAQKPAKPAKRPAPQRFAVALFAGECGFCHRLAAAGTTGTAGPNLDKLQPNVTRVLNAIDAGGRRTGLMPPGILGGSDARRVANFVGEATRR